MRPTRHLHINPSRRIPLLREQKSPEDAPQNLKASKIHTHPTSTSTSTPAPLSGAAKPADASVYFIGNATTIIEWQGLRILTDPNFLHAGDHVHLGPGVTAQRLKNPVVDLHELPPIDLVLLSHYHEDHFDKLVEEKLNRDFTIVSTPHAKGCLTSEAKVGGDGAGPFRAVHDIDTFESLMLHIDGPKQDGHAEVPVVKITAMPGEHVPPGPLAAANNLLGAVPPTNGWLVEMAWRPSATEVDSSLIDPGYRIYISGDTLFVDELKEIPKFIEEQQELARQRHPHSHSAANDNTRIDLMIVHLGGTTIPGPHMPLLMVTMDAKQGVELMKLLNPDLTMPVHFDDYSVFLSPLEDFKTEVANMGEEWRDRVVYLERGEQFNFEVRGVEMKKDGPR
ncbi:Metallo-hydrolase/oxidoreductase [Xylaria bambusicola]|uniref:Metallo-hydrolase/oxidoreductase n=1 Tax=Xylaria bambusicola TaxID=326684 RepID=UPI0020072020|nr:Metallo-hydrolase/oxidoreductase [Xylaria bambusicola]KAI0506195.1 Metallo-hydrolase/oxidoreductase [Xylaria bambusicola]